MSTPETLDWRFFSTEGAHGETAQGFGWCEYRIHYDQRDGKGYRLTAQHIDARLRREAHERGLT